MDTVFAIDNVDEIESASEWRAAIYEYCSACEELIGKDQSYWPPRLPAAAARRLAESPALPL